MKKLFLIVLTGIIGVVGIKDTYALENDSNLVTNYIDNTYAYHYKNGQLRSYGKVPFRYQNGELVYCIEPDRVINTYTYSSTNDWSRTGFSDDVKRKMELISYYGYGYPGHDSLKYYMATQELIWLYSDDSVKWMDKYSTNGSLGNQIIIDDEKNEILRLVNNHNKLPSFSNVSYVQKLGDTLNLNDTNAVFDTFNVETDLQYEKNGLNLNIPINKFGNHKMTFLKNINNNKKTTVYYYNGDSQMMASFGINEKIESYINISVINVDVVINKKDINTNKNIKQKDTTFMIKNLDNDTYITKDLKTDSSGIAKISLEKGRYEIIEIKAPNNYVINKENKIIEIDDNIILSDKEYIVDFYDDKPNGKIIINKKDEGGNNLDGVQIGLFDKNHKEITTLITTGNDSFDNLKLGTYYIKELDTLEGYILDDKEYKVDLKYQDDKTYTVEKVQELINKKIKCDIVYISSEKLSDISINVYDESDKLVFSGKTDKDGKVTITNLPYGKYHIKQIKVPKGYILNEKEYIFYVNDSTCVSNINVSNEKTVMPVTSTSINKCICLVLLFSSLGIFNYVKKTN